MLIYHIADAHLGSKMHSLKEDAASSRRVKLFSTFSKAINNASKDGVKIILLPGDIFDEDMPKESDLNNFYNLINAYPDINFYYLRGNHDLINHRNDIPNLKYFSSSFSSYKEGNIVIGGIELNKDNISSFYNEIKFNKDDYNILMLHGDIANDIDLKKLKNKNIDYIALGHIHTFQKGELDHRTSYSYSGVLLGRGYDETKEKGYVILNTDNNDIRFVPSSSEIIEEHDLDISKCASSYNVSELIKDKFSNTKIILRLNLYGDISFPRPENGLESYLESLLNNFYKSLSIKDHTTDYIDIDELKNSKSFEGELIRLVENDDILSSEEKKKIIALAIKALRGELKA